MSVKRSNVMLAFSGNLHYTGCQHDKKGYHCSPVKNPFSRAESPDKTGILQVASFGLKAAVMDQADDNG